MPTREGYVTVSRAAELLGVARNTIRSWGAAGRIAEYRHPVNNYRLYKLADIESLQDRMDKPVNENAMKQRKKKPR